MALNLWTLLYMKWESNLIENVDFLYEIKDGVQRCTIKNLLRRKGELCKPTKTVKGGKCQRSRPYAHFKEAIQTPSKEVRAN